jgi:hypothetical protein
MKAHAILSGCALNPVLTSANAQDSNNRVEVLFEEAAFPPRNLITLFMLWAVRHRQISSSRRIISFDGDLPVIKEGYETSVPGLYLIGDLGAGPKGGSINLAFNMAQEAMRNICNQCECAAR